MKTRNTSFSHKSKLQLSLNNFLLALLLIILTQSLKAQVPDYICSLKNDIQVSPTEYQFDVYIQRTGTNEFKLAQFQIGINLNPAIKNGGVLSIAPVSGSSNLSNPAQIPGPEKFTFNDTKNCIIVTPVSPPGASSASVISESQPGTCFIRLKVTNSIPFGVAQPNLSWSFSTSNGYPTKMFAYVGILNTDITTQSSHMSSELSNPVLNATLLPSAYTITGQTSYCEGSGGVPVGLADSDPGVVYTLYKDMVGQIPTITGTGQAISFGNQLAGTYTVIGTNGAGSTSMTGSLLIQQELALPASVVISTPINPVCQGTEVIFNALPTNGGVSPTYQWYVNNLPVGTNSNTLTYIPEDNDQVKVIMTSSLACVSGSPFTSAVQTMTVYPFVSPVITGPTQSCDNTAGNIYSTESGMSGYIWQVSSGGTITNGGTVNDNTITINWNETGMQSVSVLYTNGTGCSVDIPTILPVNVGSYQSPTIQGDNLTCQGSAYYTYTTEAGMLNYVWDMSPNSGTITWQNTSNEATIFWTSAGSKWVSVTYTNPQGCTVSVPAQIAVTVQPIPSEAGSIHGISTLCQGSEDVTYSIEPIDNASSYSWEVPSGATILTGGNTNSIMVNYSINALPGEVTVSGSNNCGASQPSSLNITVNQIPPTPEISVNGYELTSSSTMGNQWYKDGTPVQGATSQTYQVIETGTYSVIVTQEGCSSASSVSQYVINTVGVNEAGREPEVALYPNPSTGIFTLSGLNTINDLKDVKIFNNLGIVVSSYNNSEEDLQAKLQFDLSNQPKGIYTVVISMSKQQLVRKIVID